MKTFDVCVDATSFIQVQADTAEEAKQAARDVFSIHTVDSIDVTIMNESEEEN